MSASGAVVLAAGAASRMGRPKQTLLFDGEPLVARAVRAACAAGCSPVIVVLGAHAAAVRRAACPLAASFVENPRWSDGLGGSITAGLAAARNAGSVFLLLADQPFVDAAILVRLRSALASSGLAAAACRYGGAVGAPALFRRTLFGELSALEGDEGARRVLVRDPGRVALVDFPPGAVDVDTPEDAARVRARFR